MLTPAQAEAAIAAEVPPVADELLPLAACAGRVLRVSVRAERDAPPFDRVAMDGIAIAQSAARSGRRAFRIAGIQAAGAPALSLASADQCIEAMTGAVLPRGCDAVVPVEQIAQREGVAELTTSKAVEPWQNVHRRGSDARQGAVLLEPGVRLRGPEMAIVASAGLAEVRVARRPSIQVISTGDELVEPGQPVLDHQVRRSNPHALAAALRLAGYDDVADDHVPDDEAVLTDRLAAHLAAHDVLVLSGGVSAGRFDHVPAALARLDVRCVFHKIAQRPGLPMWFGVSTAGKPVFALPGNPVSVLVCLARYVVPALRRMEGERPNPPERVALGAELAFRPALACFLPVQVEYDDRGQAWAMPRPTRGSGDFNSLAGTDGFVELPPGPATHPRGQVATLYRW